ncbi:MAG: ComEC/Rec2 family competence protein [Lachnospiraceae bacterium]|nr:ComEC/Rec2 family competence protein [Lachnospiraceae bacterium]
MRELKLRPAIIIGLVALVWSIIYSVFLYESASINLTPKSVITIEGEVEDKTLNDEGNIKAIYVKGCFDAKKDVGAICYVNNKRNENEDYTKETKGCNFDINEVTIGTNVKIIGTCGEFAKAGNPGEFDSKRYYESKGYQFYVNVTSIEFISRPKKTIKETMFKLRVHLCNIVKDNCPIEGGTINTLLFADKSGLSDERKDLYKASGFSHFLVISGLHIFIAGGGIYKLLKKTGMKRYHAAAVGMGFILFYGTLVGFGISVFRAVFMFLLRLLADIFNRTYDLLSALFLAMTVSLISNPLCAFDSAFLYSYGAVLFTGLFFTYFRKDLTTTLYSKVYTRDGIRMKFADFCLGASVPLIIYIGLLPLTLFFQSYSTVLSIVLNLIMGLLTTPILMAGACGFFFGALHLSLVARVFDFFCAILLRITDGLSEIVSEVKCFQIVYKPTIIRVIVFYVVLFLMMFFWQRKLSVFYKFVVISSLIIFVGKPIYQPLEAYITDVGQGDGIIVRTGVNTAIINDFGSSSKSSVGKYVLIPFLKAKGITVIEDIYLSHGDADHINGIEELLENGPQNGITVRRVLLPLIPLENMDDSLLKVATSAMEKGINVEMISQGALVNYGAVKVSCIWPAGEQKLLLDDNANSMVLWVNIKNFDMLLTGDATKETEEKILKYMQEEFIYKQGSANRRNASFCNIYTEDGHIEVYKCAHHGSSTSNGAPLLEYLLPEIAVVSAARGNRYGHPHAETLETLKAIGCHILMTMDNGEITIGSDGKRMWVREWK